MPAAERPRDLPGLPNFAWVEEGALARCARPDDAAGYRAAAAMGFRTVVDLRLTGDPSAPAAEAGLRLVEIPVEPWDADDDEIAAFLRVATDPDARPVLVHCRHGADRTGMMVAAYRRCMQGWTAEQALAELPRFGFHRVHVALARRIRTLDPEALRKAAGR
jgi:tyrosine-protein phosphatase SIW14